MSMERSHRETGGWRSSGPPRAISAVLPLVLLVVLGALIYSNTFRVPFVFDDIINIVDAPIVKNLDMYSSLETARQNSYYPLLVRRYVGYLSLALNYASHGLNVPGYHAVNLLIHLLTSLVLYWLVLLTLRTPALEGSALSVRAGPVALLAAALFVAHPVQTQAVTYVVQRLASMATLFYLLSLAAYARFRLSQSRAPRWAFYLLCLASALLGMKTKEVAFTLPLAVALYEWSFFRGRAGRRVVRLLPLGLTLLVIPVTQILLSGGDMTKATVVSSISRGHYILTEFRVLVTYLRLLLFPVNQNLLYDYPVYHSVIQPGVIISILVLASLGATGVVLYRRSRLGEPGLRVTAFGIAWFFLTLSVESTLVPLNPIFEHRLYLPAAGVFMGLAAGAFVLLARLKGRRAAWWLAGLMVTAPLVLGIATYARNQVWNSELALWEDVVSKSPASAAAHINLGEAYASRQRFEDSVIQYEQALKLDLSHYQVRGGASNFIGMVHVNLGNAYDKMHQPQRALDEYKMAVSSEGEAPNEQEKYLYSEAYYNMGLLYDALGQRQDAISSYLKSVRYNAANADAHNNLGVLYFDRKDYGRALEQYLAAHSLAPNSGSVNYNLGELYYYSGKPDMALPYLERAAEMAPDLAETHYLLARVYRDMGLPSKSSEHLRRANMLNATSK
jgi:tetratricopeptide (TPR) repeat protein